MNTACLMVLNLIVSLFFGGCFQLGSAPKPNPDPIPQPNGLFSALIHTLIISPLAPTGTLIASSIMSIMPICATTARLPSLGTASAVRYCSAGNTVVVVGPLNPI